MTDKEVIKQALEFCDFILRDVSMPNEYTVEKLEATIRACRAALADPEQEPVALGAMSERVIYDTIRTAYNLGYNDARESKTTPGDSAPGYNGRDVERDHGGALIAQLARYTAPQPQPKGYKLVPVELTTAMNAAALNCNIDAQNDGLPCASFEEVYSAMLAAAPDAP